MEGPHPPAITVELTLPADPEAPTRARRNLESFRERLGPSRFEDLRLLVSELVTNSVRHAGPGAPWIKLTLAPLADGGVRVEVVDPGPGFQAPDPLAARPSLDETSGRGLYIVRELADRWGVEADGVTRVWIEVRGRSFQDQGTG